MWNNSPLHPSKSSSWTWFTSSLGSSYLTDTSIAALTEASAQSAFDVTWDENGLRYGDDQVLYFQSRLGPNSYYATSSPSQSADPANMFIEITVPQSITATQPNTDPQNVDANCIIYLASLDTLHTNLAVTDYWSTSSGYLYDAVERTICDADLD